MAKLGIDLQDGFEGDEVIVKIDGEERFRRSDVTTKRVLGLAANAKFEVPDGAVSVEICVPNRGIETRLELDVSGDTYVGVSLEGGEMPAIVRSKKFGYG